MFCHVQDEVRKSTFSLILRTRKDIMKPFEKEDSPVKQSGLMLLSVDKVILESPSYDNLWSSCTENGQYFSVYYSLQTCALNAIIYINQVIVGKTLTFHICGQRFKLQTCPYVGMLAVAYQSPAVYNEKS